VDKEIALGKPDLGDAELEAVRRVFDSGWVAGQGPATSAFEGAFATAVGAEHALAVNNCTAGLHLAMLALGVGPGDEVIVADYTYPATAHAVLYCGATPRFADVRPDIWTIDPAAAEALINDRTVGIVAVDTMGQCADYEPLREISRRNGLFLLEDAACAIGATYHGVPAGHPSLADAAAFSLHGRKGITSGEGGVVTTSDDAAASFVGSRLCFGIESALARSGSGDLPIPSFEHLGWNYKLSDIASAIASVQLTRVEELLSRRRSAASRYLELLSGLELVAPPVELDDRRHAWQTYAVTLAPNVSRGHVATELRAHGIGCNIGTFSCHVQPVYRSADLCPVSADLFARHLAIPMHANLGDDDVEYVAKTLITCVERIAD
jgi:dTDP-4-amino-4,6-dideoxygalactose transaminase